MIEYPSIINSSKAPRGHCVAFDKLDGSNFRAKWTQKRGFDTFGTKTQLINESTPLWGHMVTVFRDTLEKDLNKFLKKEFPNEREVITYGEFFGANSFAGRHQTDELGRFTEQMQIVLFDILIGHKNRHFVPPLEFSKYDAFPSPRIIYYGNLNQEFIDDIRANKYGLKEGVVCKGTQKSGAFRGHIWMAKIKTKEYFDKLYRMFDGNDKEIKKYWE